MDSMPDPTDWQRNPLSSLSSIDSLLRCDICKDFYTSAVITSCSHTFCSLCIRRCLAAEGRCPSCRAAEQESRLRKNVAVQELTDAFTAARAGLLEVGEGWRRREEEETSNTGPKRGAKRKRIEADGDVNGDERPSRRTRSQRKAAQVQAQPDGDECLVVDDSERDATYTPESSAPQAEHSPDDGLVSCPVCHQRMKEAAVSAHLDTSCPGFGHSNHYNTNAGAKLSIHPNLPPSANKHREESPKRLPQLNYSLLPESKLRKKLQELDIPSWGARPLLQRRHAEWVALWNANCDSPVPKSERALLRELDAWERSQGGNAKRVKEDYMDKDFDGGGWAKRNKNEFDDLIRQARDNNRSKKAAAAPAAANHTDAEPSTTGRNHPVEALHNGTDDDDDDDDNDDDAAAATAPQRPDFNRSLTAPPSTDAIIAHAPTSHTPPPERPTLHAPPPPVTLMWSSTSSEETPSTSASPTAQRTHLPAERVERPKREPSAASATAELSPVAGMAAVGAGLATASADGSAAVLGRRGSISRSMSGGGRAKKVHMFDVGGTPLVDGDGTGMGSTR